jgi:FkbM family methyltransferase
MGSLNRNKLSVFEKIAQRIAGIIRRRLNLPIVYRYEKFSIILPADHLLPAYQRMYPNYDRFLPHLAKYISPEDVIVDVGANVGDTLAGMVAQNSEARYICVEPDAFFFQFLEKNISRMKGTIDCLNIEAIQALVGKNVSNVSLVGQAGTKHALIGGTGEIKSRPLDEIISSDSKVRLLKSDVDGFDYDVLDSSMGVINKDCPIIFFECQFDEIKQKNHYMNTLHTLEAAGYCDWIIFDNFGEVVLRASSLSVVSQLLDYVWQQNIGAATRTIFYFDILCTTKIDSLLINDVLRDYRANAN